MDGWMVPVTLIHSNWYGLEDREFEVSTLLTVILRVLGASRIHADNILVLFRTILLVSSSYYCVEGCGAFGAFMQTTYDVSLDFQKLW